MSSSDPLAQFRRPDFTDDVRDKILFPKVYRHKKLLFWKRLTKVLVLFLILAALVYLLTQPATVGTQTPTETIQEASEHSETVHKSFEFTESPSEAAY